MERSVELDVKPLASEEIDIERQDDHVLVRALSESAPVVELHGRVSGLTPTLWRSWSRRDLIDRWDVTHVLVRDQPAGTSSFEDERTFQFLWQSGRLTAYRIRRD